MLYDRHMPWSTEKSTIQLFQKAPHIFPKDPQNGPHWAAFLTAMHIRKLRANQSSKANLQMEDL